VRSDGFPVTFPYEIGTTTIVWTVSDGGGNTVTCEQTIVVDDTELPTIECPEDITLVNEPGVCEDLINIDVPFVFDNCGIVSFENDFNGTTDATGVYSIGITTVNYTIEDVNGNLNSCSFVVDMQSPILAVKDSVETVQGYSIDILVLSNDIDCEDDMNLSTLMVITPPTHGMYSVNNVDGTISYDPSIEYFGWDYMEYQICDGQGYCSIAEVVIFVDETNKKPVLEDIYDTTYMNRSLVIRVLDYVNDPDNNNIEIADICADPVNGYIDIDYDSLIITYTPNMDYLGSDNFCIAIMDDGFPVLGDTGMVYIEVLPLTDPIIYNTMTPNGDGVNDLFIIGDLEQYPDNGLYIMNQWGDEIATFVNYNNSTVVWDCRNKDGDIVPYGTYYYILKVQHPDKVYKGWLYVYGSY